MSVIGRVYSGSVQGVGFRATTRSLARDLGLDGWVRNDDDGTVRVVASGPTDTLHQLEVRIGEHLGRGVRAVTPFEPTPEEIPEDTSGFEIRA